METIEGAEARVFAPSGFRFELARNRVSREGEGEGKMKAVPPRGRRIGVCTSFSVEA